MVDMTASVDFLTELDASFLYMESPQTPMHMGSIGIFDGGPLHDAHGCLRLDAVRAKVQSRLHLVPKLRKIVRLPLLGESAPAWVDDPDFDITYHVRAGAVPEPGDEAQLLELCSRLMSYPLDRDRPLWQIYFIDGLADGRVAVLEMIHHCMADGLAGVEIASVLLDLEARPPDRHSVDDWEPTPAPRRTLVAADGLTRFGGVVSMIAADAWQAMWHPSRAGRVLSRYAACIFRPGLRDAARAAPVAERSRRVRSAGPRRPRANGRPSPRRALLRRHTERPVADSGRGRRARSSLGPGRSDGRSPVAGARPGRRGPRRRPPAGQRDVGHVGAAPNLRRPGGGAAPQGRRGRAFPQGARSGASDPLDAVRPRHLASDGSIGGKPPGASSALRQPGRDQCAGTRRYRSTCSGRACSK